MTHNSIRWLSPIIAAFIVVPLFAKNRDTLTIVASGETHAMLLPCDCPVEPGGGLAKRAQAIKLMDRNAMLLIDAGGFSGGGLYDSYTEGRAKDSLRTMATIHAMAAMHYDAAAIGDDDLQYGGRWLAETAKKAGLPLVSANCLFRDSAFIGAPFIVVTKHHWRYAITGLTTREKLYLFKDSVEVLPPFAALKKIWPDMTKKADFQIILSHLGEEMSRVIADSFPECDIIVNGHRKQSTQPTFNQGRTLIMQFGFSGKNLSQASFLPDKRSLSLLKSGWVPITPDIPDDPAVLKLITVSTADAVAHSPKASALRETVLDLYIMSRCAFGLKALKELTDALAAFPRAEWHVWFIGSEGANGSLSSLHGADEANDEMLWLAVQALYPGKWLAFLQARGAAPETTSTKTIIKKLGLNGDKLQKWAETKGGKELAVHYNRSTRIGVQASPALLLNNSPVAIEITKPRLGKILCTQAPGSSAYCDSVPECFEDRECKKKGKVGTCVQNKGKPHCVYKDAVSFHFTVLLPDSMISHPENEIIATTRDLFEGAVVETMSVRSHEGRKLLAAFKPKALPYYLFDKKALQAENYSKIEPGVELKNDKIVFKDGYIKKAYFYKRPIIPASCDIYIDPMFPGVNDALALALQKRPVIRLRIFPLLSISPDIDSISSEERLGREESQRWLLFIEKYPAQYAGYLQSFMKRKEASYWFLSLKDLNINMDEFVGRIKTDGGRMRGLWKTQTELGLSGPVELVINNREVVRVKSQKDLGELMEKAGK